MKENTASLFKNVQRRRSASVSVLVGIIIFNDLTLQIEQTEHSSVGPLIEPQEDLQISLANVRPKVCTTNSNSHLFLNVRSHIREYFSMK